VVDVSGYEVVAVLGGGAYGVVCRARDPRMRREVALKLIPITGRPEAAERAVHEACTTGCITHENVVVIHDHGRADHVGSRACPIVFIIMELVRGESLADWVRRRRPSPADIVDVMIKAGRGLEAAHAAGVVHLDFKPANVVVDSQGRPRVVDFGLARGLSTGTASPGACGTPGYMAPEVLRGRPDACSDQFAFAVTLWELLAGVQPYEALPDGTLRMGKLQGVKKIPPQLRDIQGRPCSPTHRHATRT
jgi:eukaryotic-like serine/threonine-protein kinase